MLGQYRDPGEGAAHLFDERAALYNQLDWATNKTYLDQFFSFAGIEPGACILDVGTGTGLVATMIQERTPHIWGVDLSRQMLSIARTACPVGHFLEADARCLPFKAGCFDRVLARMVFHHILQGLELAVAECYRVLKPGGWLIVSEGVPPCPDVRAEYEEIFKLKEPRLTFLPEDLVSLLQGTGLTDVTTSLYIVPQVSVGNWLENSNCSPATQRRIMDMHRFASPTFQDAYRMAIQDNDCLIDMKFALVKGRQP